MEKRRFAFVISYPCTKPSKQDNRKHSTLVQITCQRKLQEKVRGEPEAVILPTSEGWLGQGNG
jgi:hypothetical protein